MSEKMISLKDLLFRCKDCGWYSPFHSLSFVKDSTKYKRFFACSKCNNMNFVVHLKIVDKKLEEKLLLKKPKQEELKEKIDFEEEK